MPCTLGCNRTGGWKNVCHTVCFRYHKCSTLCVRIPNSTFEALARPWTPAPARPLPRPPPPLPPTSAHHPSRTLLLLSLIATAALIGAIFMVCLLVKKLRQYHRSRPNGQALFAVQRQNLPDDDDEEEGPVLDHHVWYIHTVGLQQSVIDSITMFKYRKEEKLTDGADCSICLGEFQEDESLRLLPKCSHAFHLPCIDTWLRSHKNCPLCRAPVVSNSAAPNLTTIEPISNSNQPPPMEDTRTGMEEENRGDETSGEGTSNSRRESEIPIKGLSRTLSDLTENQNHEAVENEGQGLRRSVSMNSVSALAIYQATANIQVRDEGSSSGNSVSRNVAFPKRGIGNQSLYNLVKTISFGRCVQKGAISMKRLSSGSRKLQWPSRHFRSQSSVLPM
ncbi:E3 ubiquitin-protein ligase RING1-like [Momordica charantia]|uniref:RING-type E3 ubiquitin transferase n=1 Tax=Momordica charantia TaxID=3673 RepID=A0A6J1BT09_MOMCH|nr:E3 ubiquitin-protein ligase RING1-like [Momordica charantia]